MFYYFKQSYTGLLGLGLVGFMIFLAVFGPYILPYPQDVGRVVRMDEAFLPPSSNHLFGTDTVGRDVLTRVIAGTRLSLATTFSALALIVAIGVPLGLVAGYIGGWTNTLIMRVTDVFQAIPPILLALVVASSLSPSMENLILALVFSWWPQYTRLINGEVLSIKEEPYVEASRSLGAGSLYIMRNDLLPAVTTPLTVKMTLDLGYLILTAAGLGFLGLGVQPPTPEWGAMVSNGRVYLPGYWWICIFPGLFILLAVLGFNLFGDGLRDTFSEEI
jgi:peptide/nickel transport system permease protein